MVNGPARNDADTETVTKKGCLCRGGRAVARNGTGTDVSDSILAMFACTDTDHVLDGGDENLAIADAARACRGDDGINRAIRQIVRAHDFQFHFRKEIDDVFGTTIQFGMTFLPAETLGFGHGDPHQADFVKGFLHLIKLEGFYDGLDLFHAASSISSLADRRHSGTGSYSCGNGRRCRARFFSSTGLHGLGFQAIGWYCKNHNLGVSHCRIMDRMAGMKPANAMLSALPTTIFSVMSALAVEHDAVNLGQGFPDTEGPADLIDVAAAALRDGRNQYPPLAGVPELRTAVASANLRFCGIEVDPATEVVVTCGATEAITASLMALVNPGDEVVVFEPLYDTYLPVLRMLGAVVRPVRLLPPDWSVPRAELAAAVGPRTKAILLNTPMNPTGKVFTRAELEFIADLMTRHDVYAVCDEVYEHLTFAPVRHVALMSLPQMKARTIRIGSAGKSFSMTGWKVGYVTAPAPLAALVAKAHQLLTFTVAPNLQRAVAVGLEKDGAYFLQLSENMRRSRDMLVRGLRDAGFDVLPCDGSYFVIADFAPLGFAGDDVAFCQAMTRRLGVTGIPVSAFYDPDSAPGPRTLVRFAFCKRPEVISEAVRRLRGVGELQG